MNSKAIENLKAQREQAMSKRNILVKTIQQQEEKLSNIQKNIQLNKTKLEKIDFFLKHSLEQLESATK